MDRELKPLQRSVLRRACDPAQFAFETTAELDDLREIIGQERASEAIEFGIRIRHGGYNLFVLGPTGTGKRYVVSRYLKQQASDEPVPDDWCYVHNFTTPREPRALRLPPGKARPLEKAMDEFVRDLCVALPSTFESDTYKRRRHQLEINFQMRREGTLREIQQRANSKSIALIETEEGIGLAPLREGEALTPDKLQSLPEEEQKAIQEAISEIRNELREMASKMPVWEREHVKALEDLNNSVCEEAVAPFIQTLREGFAGQPSVLEWLDDVESDIQENLIAFLHDDDSDDGPRHPMRPAPSDKLKRYKVNVFVNHEGASGAPTVYEDYPTLGNLIGRIEHRAEMGALTTNLHLVRPGALHRANGGYLMIEARKLLEEPAAWDQLKRAMRSGEIRIESLSRAMGNETATTLEPEPIPLQIKIILLGERHLYYRLHEVDPDFSRLFKVAADFEDDMPRTAENEHEFARLLGTLIHQDDLLPFDRSAVARIVEESSRLSGHQDRLSTHIQSLWSLLHEADHRATVRGAECVTADDIDATVRAQNRRSGRIRERQHESIDQGMVLIDTAGERVGQINGLSVLTVGNASFGQPNRISARAQIGRGEFVNIERESRLSGPIHDKGVLILAGYLGARYTLNWPLALRASLVFEQSYGGVDGDSASLAELCALLSELANVPLYQGMAVTGSVNQHGEVQAVGGVNAKIEGFFDVCKERGLTGEQGVILPLSNVQNLMLRPDVVRATEEGKFHIYAVRSVDRAMELLTGVPAGDKEDSGQFASYTINQRVQSKLAQFAKSAAEWSIWSAGHG